MSNPFAQMYHGGTPQQAQGLSGMLFPMIANKMGMAVVPQYYGNTNYVDHVLNQQERQLRTDMGQEAIRNDLQQARQMIQTGAELAGAGLSPEGRAALNNLTNVASTGATIQSNMLPNMLQGMGMGQLLDYAAGGVSEFNIGMGLAQATQGAIGLDGSELGAGRKAAMAYEITNRLRADPIGFSGAQTAEIMQQMNRRGLMPGMTSIDSMVESGLIGAEDAALMGLGAGQLGLTGEGLATTDAELGMANGRQAAKSISDYAKQLRAVDSILKDDGLNASIAEMSQLLDELGGQSGRFVGADQSIQMLRRMDQAADAVNYSTTEMRAVAAAGRGMAQAAGYQEGPMGQIATTTMLEARQAYGNMGINDLQIYGMANDAQLAQSSALGLFNAQESNEGQRYAAASRLAERAGEIDTSTAEGSMFAAYIADPTSEKGQAFLNLSVGEQNRITAQATGNSVGVVQQQGMNRRANEEYYAKNEGARDNVDSARHMSSREALGRTMEGAMYEAGRGVGASAAQRRSVAEMFVAKTMSADPSMLSDENRDAYLDKVADEIANDTGMDKADVRSMIDNGMDTYRGQSGGQYADQVALHGDKALEMRKHVTERNKSIADIRAAIDSDSATGLQAMVENLSGPNASFEGALTRALGFKLNDEDTQKLKTDIESANALSGTASNLEAEIQRKQLAGETVTEEEHKAAKEARAKADSAKQGVRDTFDGLRGEDTSTSEEKAAEDREEEYKKMGETIGGTITSLIEGIKNISLTVTNLVIDSEDRGPASGGGEVASATPNADELNAATTK